MKPHMFTLCLLIIGVFFFQPTHQYRLSKRELTEFDLTSFIVTTCSGEKIDMLIQNLCDQTLQSALMGNFPYLIYYCTTIGDGTRYCHNINRYTLLNQDVGTKKRSVSRRLARSLNNEEKEFAEQGQAMGSKIDSDLKLIMQICMSTTMKKISWETIEFCNRTLHERYPEMIELCKIYPDVESCRLVQFYSSLTSRPFEATRSMPAKVKPAYLSSIESNMDQAAMKRNKQEPSSRSASSS